jgi:hypothetical protein
MRRERKREETERRFATRQERLRERRQRKNSSSVEACQPADDGGPGYRRARARYETQIAGSYLASFDKCSG